MATLILSTAGALIGGSIGRAVGAIAGQAIDRSLLGGKGTEGPRLADLAVASSQYGAPLPRLYGQCRVAGTMIWATDLREERRRQSNGKGQPKTTVYSYSASFAIALSSRPIRRIGRIWADGRLLRGAAGDLKVPLVMRVHAGDEGQAADPLIASAEGLELTPAYRGLAYVMFEDMALADFGNRIPALSFEVIADEGDVSIGTIINDLAPVGVSADLAASVGGFAAYGATIRAVIEALAPVTPLIASDDGAVLRITDRAVPCAAVGEDDLGAAAGLAPGLRFESERRSAATLPERIAFAYADPARDYQPGLQRAQRDGGARREMRIDLPLVLNAERARGIAQAELDRLWRERTSATLRLPWRRLDLAPGALVSVAGTPGLWRVRSLALNRMVIEAGLVRSGALAPVTMPAEAGRSLLLPDQPHGPTRFHILDLPPLSDGAQSQPDIVVAAAGPSPGWRRAALLISRDGGQSWNEAGSTAPAAIIGTALSALPTASASIADEQNHVDILLANSAMMLNDAAPAGLNGGQNLAMLGDELLQFGRALPLGEGRWRLSHFFRGRRGSEWAMAAHQPGERFILIERDTLAGLSVSAGDEILVMAAGIGDGNDPPVAAARIEGRARLPLSPVHLRAAPDPSGGLHLSWIRRSRDGWRWHDVTDVPLAEESERYRISVVTDEAPPLIFESDRAALALPPLPGARRLTVMIVQLGLYGVSRPAVLSLDLARPLAPASAMFTTG